MKTPFESRQLTDFEKDVLEWIKAHPGRTSAEIANAFSAMLEHHEDELTQRTHVFRTIGALISEGYARMDPVNQSIIHFEHLL